MIKGLNRFSEYFSGFENSYVLIGGAASHILEDEAQLVPRATKDLDIILVVEALSDEFVAKFWSFIKEDYVPDRFRSKFLRAQVRLPVHENRLRTTSYLLWIHGFPEA